jgi:hypothetical protein
MLSDRNFLGEAGRAAMDDDASTTRRLMEAAEIIAAVIDKPVRFVEESPEQARARRIREGVPPAVIESVLAIGAYQRAGGKTVTITSTIADLIGRAPRTVAEFVREHASSFRGTNSTTG